MTRPAPRRIAGCLVTGLLAVVLTPLTTSASADEATSHDAPLRVSIDTLNPSTIPRRGKVTVTGRITNSSDSRWTDLKVYLLTSAAPMRTDGELKDASATDPAAVVGARLTGGGLYDTVGALAPGASAPYVLSVSRKDLEITGDPGVYWLGVHVLGADENGHDSFADGRARSFLPLMAARGPTTSLSLVVPVKGKVRRQADGSLADLSAWRHMLGLDGRLGRLLQLSAGAEGMFLTWVVDPAVLDAAESVAGDNPPMNIGPSTDTPGGAPSASNSPSGTPSDEPSQDTTAPPLSDSAQNATDWLREFRRQAPQHTVLNVPYGDLDVASALRGDFDKLYRRATVLSTETMAGAGVASEPVVAPPSGYLQRGALDKIDPQTPVLLSDRAIPGALGPVVDAGAAAPVVLTDSSAGSGGPPPTRSFATLAMRQRILSEAAVHALSPDRDQPLVVSTPQLWNPGRDWQTADFFSGLDVDWLRFADLPTVVASAALRVDEPAGTDDSLSYPAEQRSAEVPIANLLASQELGQTGAVFAGLLARNDTVDADLAKSGLLASSTRARSRPRSLAFLTRETNRQIHLLMDKVRIEGPPFVTMSSEAGTFVVTIVNDLEESVTVGIRADTGTDELVIPSPDPVTLGPGQRASVRLRANSKGIGVHSVTLTPTNAYGQPLGNQSRFSVRSSQVGLVIWVVMGIGAAVLFITAGFRIALRIRERKTTDGPLLKGEET